MTPQNSITVTIDSVQYESKPTDAADITKRFTRQTGTVAELAAELVAGRTWCPGVFRVDGVRTNDQWSEQSVFALDADSGILSHGDIVERCNRYNIVPAFIHTSFSHTAEKPKYRVVFVSPVVITHPRIRDVIQLALMRIFPEFDASVKDAARMFFGGKEVVFSDYGATLDILGLFSAVAARITDEDAVNATRNIKSWCQSVGLNQRNGLPAVYEIDGAFTKSEETAGTAYIYIANPVKSSHLVVELAEIKSISWRGNVKYAPVKNEKVSYALIEDTNFIDLYEKCNIFRDHMEGIDTHHDITFALATNLARLKGGEAVFFVGLEKRSTYDAQKWQRAFAYIRKMQYLPTRYDSEKMVAHYPVAPAHGANNLFQLAQYDKIRIQQIRPTVFKELAIVEKEMHAHVKEWLTSKPAHAMTVLKVSVGVGKTQAAIEHVEAPCIIAAPTHALKLELAERFRVIGKDVFVTPEMPDSIGIADRQIIDRFYALGAPNKAVMHLRALAKTNVDVAGYIEHIQAIGTYSGILLCTHARLPYLASPIQRVIIDEDILPTLLPTGTASYAELHTLHSALLAPGATFGEKARPTPASRYIGGVIKYIDSVSPGQLAKLPTFAFSGQAKLEQVILKQHKISTNLLGFLRSVSFIKSENGSIFFITRKSLLPNKTYLVLSATSNKRLYDLAFGSANFLDTGHVANKGQLVQYPRYSMSRASLRAPATAQSRIEYVAARAPESSITITYKALKALFANQSDLHFGNTSGIDKYAGKTLAIVGTPHLKPETYLLYAGALNVDIQTHELSADTLEERIIERNGFRFQFVCYPESSILHEIQLSLIENDLIQAVGRARLVRNDAGYVVVFSNMPLVGATLITQ